MSTSKSIDPVCGMEVGADSPHRAMHQGQEYRFCSASCLATFQKEPARYTGKQGTGAPARSR